jgi:hypothetical protein
MPNPFEIVKDSSVWFSSDSFGAANKTDAKLRIGIVKRAYNDAESGELHYLVEVQDLNDKIELNCRMLRRFGGVYNYEDYIDRGYKISDKPDTVASFDAKAGDAVLVGQMNGQGREGLIIGGLTHAARKTTLDAKLGPQFRSEFNGIETSINADGEHTITFKGQPTNLAALNNSPSKKIATPTYNTSVGTSFQKFDKTGSWEVSDNSTIDKQRIRVDKANGQILIDAGKISIKMVKSSEAVSLAAKLLDCKVADKISMETKEFLIDSSTRAFIKSPKVAIGKEGVELLDQLAQLVDALGKVQPISPVGPCTPLVSAPNWAGVDAIKAKIKEITGSF